MKTTLWTILLFVIAISFAEAKSFDIIAMTDSEAGEWYHRPGFIYINDPHLIVSFYDSPENVILLQVDGSSRQDTKDENEFISFFDSKMAESGDSMKVVFTFGDNDEINRISLLHLNSEFFYVFEVEHAEIQGENKIPESIADKPE